MKRLILTAIRLHLGEHFRIGSEGYVSTLNQRGCGSYLKYGWGGLLADYHKQGFMAIDPFIGCDFIVS